MSIYATLWSLRFPRTGQYFPGCDWIEVHGQAVPGWVGTPTPGWGWEDGDPYGDLLPPPIVLEGEDDKRLRAVFIVTAETKKGTDRCGQEYVDPLLIFTGEEYARLSFDELYKRICDALLGDGPRVCSQTVLQDGTLETTFSDRSIQRKALREWHRDEEDPAS
jgi:hypothetical protein